MFYHTTKRTDGRPWATTHRIRPPKRLWCALFSRGNGNVTFETPKSGFFVPRTGFFRRAGRARCGELCTGAGVIALVVRIVIPPSLSTAPTGEVTRRGPPIVSGWKHGPYTVRSRIHRGFSPKICAAPSTRFFESQVHEDHDRGFTVSC